MIAVSTIPQVQTRKGDPAIAIFRSAMSQTKQRDAFQFKDRDDHTIHVERVKLAHYGYCFRILHTSITYVLPYNTTATRTNAALLVIEYLRLHALWPTLKLLPNKALTFIHDYRGDDRSSRQYVIQESWNE